MDLYLDRNLLLEKSNEEIFDVLNEYSGYDLCSMSIAWRDSEQYILKCKGSYGDIVVHWVKGGILC